ncbi:hypothetical protein GCM10020000_03350 [Streptomyces olivoverticillatus]
MITAENGSAGWFTRAGQPGLSRQADAYLKAAEELAWEEVLTPTDPAATVRSTVRREAIGVVAAVIPLELAVLRLHGEDRSSAAGSATRSS